MSPVQQVRIEDSNRVEHPIRGIMFTRRITHQQAAEAIGYSAAYFTQVVNGRAIPSSEFRKRVSEYLGVPTHELFADETPPPSPRPKRTKTA